MFDVEVPVVAHELADPEKGTGIAMICTFGDLTDVTWWRELDLPVRAIIGRDGRIAAERPGGDHERRRRCAAYARIAGKTIVLARRRRWSRCSRETGELVGEPRPITHPVKFYEKGDKPLEIVTTRQWYIRNGGRDDDLRDALLARGAELKWHPPYMQGRYDSWVAGLNGDWLVSRQRFFGVPIPLWYRARRRRRAGVGSSRSCRPRTTLPDRSVERRAARVTAKSSGASPTASSAIPT